MVLINFNLWRWSCACVGTDNWVNYILFTKVQYQPVAQHTNKVLYNKLVLNFWKNKYVDRNFLEEAENILHYHTTRDGPKEDNMYVCVTP